MSWLQNKGLGLERRWGQLGGGFGGAVVRLLLQITMHQSITLIIAKYPTLNK